MAPPYQAFAWNYRPAVCHPLTILLTRFYWNHLSPHPCSPLLSGRRSLQEDTGRPFRGLLDDDTEFGAFQPALPVAEDPVDLTDRPRRSLLSHWPRSAVIGMGAVCPYVAALDSLALLAAIGWGVQQISLSGHKDSPIVLFPSKHE